MLNTKLFRVLLLVLVALAATLAPPRLLALGHGRVVVADRGSGSITVIDTRTDNSTTIAMPPGNNMPEPMYVVFSPIKYRVFVGDRANDRVVVFDARDLSVEAEVPTGAGVFHMWASLISRQLWVNNDMDNTITVVDTLTHDVIETIPVPEDLVQMGGRPHDVILDPVAPFAYITMIGLEGPSDYVVKYSTRTFQEVGRQEVGKDPHVSLTWRDRLLYVPCQGSDAVFVLDRRTLSVMPSIPVPGAHGAGMTLTGRTFYTTNLPSAGPEGLFAIDTRTQTVVNVTDTPLSTPHNVVLTPNGRKLYLTHSGSNNQVSVYRVGVLDRAPKLLGTVTTGQNPFGLDYVP